MKILKWAILAVVLLAVIGLGIFYVSLNRIVRSTVEKQGTASLNTQLSLDSASVSPLRGKVSLSDLAIASPPGYAADKLFKLGNVSVSVSYSELRQDPVRISTISLKDPVVTLEQKDLKTNIQALMDRIPKGPDTSPDPDQKPIKMIIGQLTVENPTVILRPGFPGLPQELKLSLPTLTLKDVGTAEGNQNGAAIKDVVMLVLTDIAAKAADSDQLPPELRQLLSMDSKQLAARLKQELNVQVEKISADLSKKIGGELGNVVGDVLKNPTSATTNPSAAIEQGIGALLKDRAEKKSSPTTAPRKKK